MSATPSSRLFDQTATLINPTAAVESGTNARKPTYGSGASYSCSVQPMSSREAFELGRDYSESLSKGYFPYGTTIASDAKITVGSTVYRTLGPGRIGAGKQSYVEVDLVTEAITNV